MEWQESGGNCLWCRAPFEYRITSSGPWAINRDSVTCSECDPKMKIELLHEPQQGTTVRTKPVEPGRAGLILRRIDASASGDFVNKHALRDGESLELRRLPKKWIGGRYEWNGDANEAAQFWPDDGSAPHTIDTTRIYRCAR